MNLTSKGFSESAENAARCAFMGEEYGEFSWDKRSEEKFRSPGISSHVLRIIIHERAVRTAQAGKYREENTLSSTSSPLRELLYTIDFIM